jgi:hypothetical protein
LDGYLLRFFLAIALLSFSTCALAEDAQPTSELPDAPSYVLSMETSSSSDASLAYSGLYADPDPQVEARAAKDSDKPRPTLSDQVDDAGNPIPLDRLQPKRILGFMPNFRSVSGGSKPHPPGWDYNLRIATHQAFDWSSFIFLGITSMSAEGINSHPVLRKGVHGFYSYTWRGLLDKTDGTYIGAWFLPSLLHEDTRYYALANDHRVVTRVLYIISRQGVTRTYGGHQTPNIAGLGGKVLTQLVSREYYPTGATSFGVLATKFGYSAMRDVAFTSIREFYPDIAAHYIRKHRAKLLRQQQQQQQQPSVAHP